jgi:hypothetical protein
MCYKELGLILIIVILLALMFFLEGRLPQPTKVEAVKPVVDDKSLPLPLPLPLPLAQTNKKAFNPKPVEAIKQPSDHSYPFPRMMDGYLDDTMLQRPCTKDGDCISGNCGSYGYCAAQYKKLVPSSKFLYSDSAAELSFGSWLNK